MSDFKAKMHQIQFRQSPRPSWGSLQSSPDTLGGFNFARQGGQGKWWGKGGKRNGEGGRERKGRGQREWERRGGHGMRRGGKGKGNEEGGGNGG